MPHGITSPHWVARFDISWTSIELSDSITIEFGHEAVIISHIWLCHVINYPCQNMSFLLAFKIALDINRIFMMEKFPDKMQAY